MEESLKSPLDSKSNQSVLKEINTVFIGRTDAEALILWPLDGNSCLIEKDPYAGKH